MLSSEDISRVQSRPSSSLLCQLGGLYFSLVSQISKELCSLSLYEFLRKTQSSLWESISDSGNTKRTVLSEGVGRSVAGDCLHHQPRCVRNPDLRFANQSSKYMLLRQPLIELQIGCVWRLVYSARLAIACFPEWQWRSAHHACHGRCDLIAQLPIFTSILDCDRPTQLPELSECANLLGGARMVYLKVAETFSRNRHKWLKKSCLQPFRNLMCHISGEETIRHMLLLFFCTPFIMKKTRNSGSHKSRDVEELVSSVARWIGDSSRNVARAGCINLRPQTRTFRFGSSVAMIAETAMLLPRP